MKRLHILLAMFAPVWAFGQVYKCTDAKGKIVFQETACDANRNANRVNVSPSSGGFEPPPADARSPKPADSGRADGPQESSQKAPPQSASTGSAENRRFIKVGMSQDEVVASIGPPDSIKVTSAHRYPGATRVVNTFHAVYEPRAGDDQTRTTVYYVGEYVNQVKRDVARSAP
jgi:hypothetical protein